MGIEIKKENVGPSLRAALDRGLELVSMCGEDGETETEPLILAHMKDVLLDDPERIATIFIEAMKPADDAKFAAVLMDATIPRDLGKRNEFFFHNHAEFLRSIMLRAGRDAFGEAIFELHNSDLAEHYALTSEFKTSAKFRPIEHLEKGRG